jgi:hypothetical protein
MRTRRALFAAVLAGLITILWIVPAVAGPFQVDCNDVAAAECEAAWRSIAESERSIFPVTAVEVHHGGPGSDTCGNVILWRWVLGGPHLWDC